MFSWTFRIPTMIFTTSNKSNFLHSILLLNVKKSQCCKQFFRFFTGFARLLWKLQRKSTARLTVIKSFALVDCITSVWVFLLLISSDLCALIVVFPAVSSFRQWILNIFFKKLKNSPSINDNSLQYRRFFFFCLS